MNLPWLKPETEALSAELDAGRLGHAPMLLGPPGSGKRALGEWLAQRILCLEPVQGEPCGRCRSCTLIQSGTHPDLFRLGLQEERSEIVVDQVREFIASLGLTPSIGSRRVGLIEPADRLNRNAANALLKTLEEPSNEVWIVLVTDHQERLPITVLSRCQQRAIRSPEPELARDWLAARTSQTDPQRCSIALELADGAPLLAEQWLGDDRLDQALALRDALAELIAGNGDPTLVLRLWASMKPREGWAWLARFSFLWARMLQGQASEVLQGLPMPRSSAAGSLLAESWSGALEGTRLAERPIRHDWMLQAWLTRWRRLADS
jgi:DNA polymerase-3 subunit delta'